jgi:hypothetical protein
MTIKLIGLAGKAGTGKDTAADHLEEHHAFARYAFAAPIRAMLAAGLDIDDEYFRDRELKEAPLPPYGVSEYPGDAIINNTGSLRHLYDCLDNIVPQL